MPAEDFRRYTEAVNNASLLAQRDLQEAWAKLSGVPPEGVREALLQVVPGIIWKYGGIAALAAAEYFEAERIAAGGGQDYKAELADGVPLEQVEASVRYAMGHMFPEGGEGGIRSGGDASLLERNG